MEVTIMYDNLQSGLQELKYFSKYERINARGLHEEARNVLIKNYGQKAKNYEILDIFRE